MLLSLTLTSMASWMWRLRDKRASGQARTKSRSGSEMEMEPPLGHLSDAQPTADRGLSVSIPWCPANLRRDLGFGGGVRYARGAHNDALIILPNVLPERSSAGDQRDHLL